MTIKIEYDIELTEAQAKTILQLARVPEDKLRYWMQGYLYMAALQRLQPWVGGDIAGVPRWETTK